MKDIMDMESKVRAALVRIDSVMKELASMAEDLRKSLETGGGKRRLYTVKWSSMVGKSTLEGDYGERYADIGEASHRMLVEMEGMKSQWECGDPCRSVGTNVMSDCNGVPLRCTVYRYRKDDRAYDICKWWVEELPAEDGQGQP